MQALQRPHVCTSWFKVTSLEAYLNDFELLRSETTLVQSAESEGKGFNLKLVVLVIPAVCDLKHGFAALLQDEPVESMVLSHPDVTRRLVCIARGGWGARAWQGNHPSYLQHLQVLQPKTQVLQPHVLQKL